MAAEVSPRLYILVRRDLSRSVQAVQAAHAAIELVHAHKELNASWGPCGPTIAMLGVADGAELDRWRMRLWKAGAVVFHEPDLGDVATALAYYGADHYGLSKLRLLG